MHLFLKGIAFKLQDTSWVVLPVVLVLPMTTSIGKENNGWKGFSRVKSFVRKILLLPVKENVKVSGTESWCVYIIQHFV